MGGNAMSSSRAVEAPGEETTYVTVEPAREEQGTDVGTLRGDRERPPPDNTAAPVVGVVEADSSRDRTPRIPNLAAAALERLASAVSPHDESADDFQPVRKKRRLKDASEENSETEEEEHSEVRVFVWRWVV